LTFVIIVYFAASPAAAAEEPMRAQRYGQIKPKDGRMDVKSQASFENLFLMTLSFRRKSSR
jgi:hypothetical protein